MTEPLMSATVPRRIFPKTKGWPILTFSRDCDEETELLPMAPVSLTGKTDLKFESRMTIFESSKDCLRSSFSDRRVEF